VTGRTLVAGVGNVFLTDDAFGVEVARLLARRPWPDGVEIADFGIRGVHLVFELLGGCDLFVLIDAAPRGLAPGTVTVLEVDPAAATPDAALMDAHDLTPDAIFAMLASMGGHPGRSLVVACEPADLGAGMGLSDPVRAALPHAVRLRTFSDNYSKGKVGDMLGKLVKAAVLAAVLALVIDSLPDIKRYLELREM